MWIKGKNLKLTKIKCACGCKRVIGKVLNISKQYFIPGHNKYEDLSWTKRVVINEESNAKYLKRGKS